MSEDKLCTDVQRRPARGGMLWAGVRRHNCLIGAHASRMILPPAHVAIWTQMMTDADGPVLPLLDGRDAVNALVPNAPILWRDRAIQRIPGTWYIFTINMGKMPCGMTPGVFVSDNIFL